ncbi:MAG: YncE family protein [Flavobacteriales bacterium]|nr:YncE family protein [Flavobacteriales bacterium]
MKTFVKLLFICGSLAIMNSCNNKDGCEDTVCQNGGICVEGECQCPDGFSGPNCEIASFNNGVFVVHEGNFQGGNASLSFYSKDTEVMSNGVFASVNNIPLGDVGQSMEIHGGKGYIVVNNSGKIEVVDLDGLSSVGTITGLTSPRYITFLTDTKAYVSDLFSGVVSIIDPQTLTIQGSISISGQTEQMVVTGSGLMVAGTGANYVYKVDVLTDLLADSVNVGIGPSNLAMDANGKVWVLTNGGWGTEVPKLVRIDPSDMSVEMTLNFPSTNNYPGNLEISGDGNTLYYVDGQVYQMDINSNALPTTAFASAFAYKCGIDPVDDIVYVSDAGDFNSNGKVYRYEANGTPIDTFNVGVIPAEYAFTE